MWIAIDVIIAGVVGVFILVWLLTSARRAERTGGQTRAQLRSKGAAFRALRGTPDRAMGTADPDLVAGVAAEREEGFVDHQRLTGS
jgi:hypothetical protein